MDTGTEQQKAVMIFANGGKQVGWGHIMRCCSIGKAATELGAKVVFAVLNHESASLVSSFGFDFRLMHDSPSDPEPFAQQVINSMSEACAQVLLVDSYGVTDSLFRTLSSFPIKVAYIDDLYLEEQGRLRVPEALDVDLVVNYGFAFEDADYKLAYGDTRTQCLVGPLYAPVRQSFSDLHYSVDAEVNSVLVTSGSTNPNQALEQMIRACDGIDETIEINVVVGRNVTLDVQPCSSRHIVLHRNISDLSELMLRSDVTLSSAGSTLYELACVGVPTIALPVVDNQMENARGFNERELGLVITDDRWESDQVHELLLELIEDYPKRLECSCRMREVVDGKGALRIANALLAIA